MSKNRMERDEILNRTMKLKKMLYDGTYQHKGGEWHDGAHTMLNKLLDIIQEYRY